jgi:hypothetical protein|tara:strand:+ start:168 stop:449 length:282 start_codon:yes stop_codon:yes gene_type:complete
MSNYGKYIAYANEALALEAIQKISKVINALPAGNDDDVYINALPSSESEEFAVQLVEFWKQEIIQALGQEAWDNAPYLTQESPFIEKDTKPSE